jgi:hypothetical protein
LRVKFRARPEEAAARGAASKTLPRGEFPGTGAPLERLRIQTSEGPLPAIDLGGSFRHTCYNLFARRSCGPRHPAVGRGKLVRKEGPCAVMN